MTESERKQRAEEIAERARAVAAPARPTFIASECDGDAELLRDVSVLAEVSLDGLIGSRVGRQDDIEAPGYRVLERLGEGGMGAVYLAEQFAPLRRKVALKVIKIGMDTREVVARFEGERQALALMNHPSIAKVFDAGVTKRSRPYFAMEYVPGLAINEYCDRHKLRTHERLILFGQVCDAIQHAHQKGIIHRDLKPSNVLVTTESGQPMPKVIDFGVAKATQQRLTEHTLHTHQGQVVGTPAYMSPEQADLRGEDIDTRTDIYSLGVILYEVLVGALPFDPKLFREAGFLEAMRVIREEDPVRPSTRISSLGDSTAHVAASRRTDLSSLRRQLRGDLDWITLKAMDKSRHRRYESAAALRADIERHLKDEPVSARPPSAAYLTRKLVRKHRAAFIGSLAVIVALVVGLVAASLEYFRANENEAAAIDAAKLAQSRYEEVLRLADLKRLRDFTREAEAFWPATPEKVPAMSKWLDAARVLIARLPDHRAKLEEIRVHALPYTELLERIDREAHPKFRRLAELIDRRRTIDEELLMQEIPWKTTWLRDTRRGVQTEIEAIEKEMEADRRWYFSDAERGWQHDMLNDLVRDIEAFAASGPPPGVFTSVESRHAFASQLVEASIEKYRDEWNRVIREISDQGLSPSYRGTILRPQLGLVPLGRDPRSGLQEFAHLASGTAPTRGSDGNLQITEENGIVLVLLPGATFAMGAVRPDDERPLGSPNVDPQALDREGPVTEIELAPFFISKFELTQAQWLRATGSNPSAFHPGNKYAGEQRSLLNPVENINWAQSDLVLRRLGLALPTEAQWEYAARGGTDTVWWFGNEKTGLSAAGNLADRSTPGTRPWAFDPELDDGRISHAPIGTFAPNPFGLHDTIGNVQEWVRDWYFDWWMQKTRPNDGERIIVAENPRFPVQRRVVRGGSYAAIPSYSRSANRHHVPPVWLSDDLGVRPARAIDASP
jgi:serine/threonine protein kinase/formylglycine-generating enzyme required for sulfatase activity